MDALHKTRKKNWEIKDGGKYYRATIVHPETVAIDEKGLAKALGAKAFAKVTDQKVNRSKLEKALSEGEVDPATVAPFLTPKSNNPYIRLSEGVLDDADEPADAGD